MAASPSPFLVAHTATVKSSADEAILPGKGLHRAGLGGEQAAAPWPQHPIQEVLPWGAAVSEVGLQGAHLAEGEVLLYEPQVTSKSFSNPLLKSVPLATTTHCSLPSFSTIQTGVPERGAARRAPT